MTQVVVNAPNRWRLETPGADWPRSARPDAAKKYFMVSADGHANEPANLWVERIDAKYRERLPRVITDKDGVQWRVSEGHRPDRLRLSTLEGEDQLRAKAGADPLGRLADHDLDGIDVELIFPNKGLAMWATPDPEFAMAQCRVFNDWAWEPRLTRCAGPVTASAAPTAPTPAMGIGTANSTLARGHWTWRSRSCGTGRTSRTGCSNGANAPNGP